MSTVIGLTGSIGMGKTTTAQIFAEHGVPVWDADAAVHRLYAPGAGGSRAIAAIFPEVVGASGVDRQKLKIRIATDPSVLNLVERLIHPLVAQDRAAFLAEHEGAPVVLLDIPLLFETGLSETVDLRVVVSVDAGTQRQRVLGRGTMTEDQFEDILARQMPDAEKRARADHVIVTDTLDHARQQVESLLNTLKAASDA